MIGRAPLQDNVYSGADVSSPATYSSYSDYPENIDAPDRIPDDYWVVCSSICRNMDQIFSFANDVAPIAACEQIFEGLTWKRQKGQLRTPTRRDECIRGVQ
jgi:hypothetical protein